MSPFGEKIEADKFIVPEFQDRETFLAPSGLEQPETIIYSCSARKLRIILSHGIKHVDNAACSQC